MSKPGLQKIVSFNENRLRSIGPVKFHNLAFLHDHDLYNYQKIFTTEVCSTNPVVVNDGPQPVCDGDNGTICKLS